MSMAAASISGFDRVPHMFQGPDVLFDGLVENGIGADGPGALLASNLADAFAVGGGPFDQPGPEYPLHGAESVIPEGLGEADHA